MFAGVRFASSMFPICREKDVNIFAVDRYLQPVDCFRSI